MYVQDFCFWPNSPSSQMDFKKSVENINKNVNKVICNFCKQQAIMQIFYTFLLRFFFGNKFDQRWCAGKNQSSGHIYTPKCFFSVIWIQQKTCDWRWKFSPETLRIFGYEFH